MSFLFIYYNVYLKFETINSNPTPIIRGEGDGDQRHWDHGGDRCQRQRVGRTRHLLNFLFFFKNDFFKKKKVKDLQRETLAVGFTVAVRLGASRNSLARCPHLLFLFLPGDSFLRCLSALFLFYPPTFLLSTHPSTTRPRANPTLVRSVCYRNNDALGCEFWRRHNKY